MDGLGKPRATSVPVVPFLEGERFWYWERVEDGEGTEWVQEIRGPEMKVVCE